MSGMSGMSGICWVSFVPQFEETGMTLNLDTKRGPCGNRILHLPKHSARFTDVCKTDDPPATTHAPTAAPPTQPARLDPLEVLRGAKPRKATRAQLDTLARKWSRA